MGENRIKNISHHTVRDNYPQGFGRLVVQAVRRQLFSRKLNIFKNEKLYTGIHDVCKWNKIIKKQVLIFKNIPTNSCFCCSKGAEKGKHWKSVTTKPVPFLQDSSASISSVLWSCLKMTRVEDDFSHLKSAGVSGAAAWSNVVWPVQKTLPASHPITFEYQQKINIM